MKKIVALVLALALALSLCTVAMATESAAKYDIDNAKTMEPVEGMKAVSLNKTAAKSAKAGGTGNVEYYTIGDSTAKYVKVADSEDATLVVYKASKTDVQFYLAEAVHGGVYSYAKSIAKVDMVGDKCEQLPEDDWDDVDVYKVVDKDGNVNYYKESKDLATDEFFLYNGEVVEVAYFNYANAMNGHDFDEATYNDDDEVVTYKCADCGKVATYYKNRATAEAKLGSDVQTYNTDYYFALDTVVTSAAAATTTTTVDSSKTFDAGVASYVALSLMSVAGSAVVIGKKKEF